MPELTEAERQYLTETQSLTRNEAGREVLIGLTDLRVKPADGVSQVVGGGKHRPRPGKPVDLAGLGRTTRTRATALRLRSLKPIG